MKTILTVLAWAAIWLIADQISLGPEILTAGFWREVFIAGAAGLVVYVTAYTTANSAD